MHLKERLQKNDEELSVLNQGHEQVKLELVHLLSFALDKMQNDVKKIYDIFLLNNGNILSKEEDEWIQSFLDLKLEDFSKNPDLDLKIDEIKAKILGFLTLFNSPELIDDSSGIQEMRKTFEEIGDKFCNINISVSERGKYIKAEQWKDIFSELPSNTLIFSYSNQYMKYHKAQVVADIFGSIPKGIKRLNLNGNKLTKFTREYGYNKIFAALPPDLLYLGLQGSVPVRDQNIENFAKDIPRTLKELDISGNLFGHEDVSKMQEMFGCLPEGLVSLDLSDMALYRFNKEEVLENVGFFLMNGKIGKNITVLKRAFSSLPQGLHKLSLSNNKLGHFKAKDLIMILSSLPRGLKRLDLSNSDCVDYTTEEIVSIVNALPPDLEVLGWKSMNIGMFDNKTKGYLEEFLKALPKGLKILDISDNYVGGYAPIRMKKILKNLPKGLKILHMSGTCSDTPFKREHLGLPDDLIVTGVIENY